MSKRTRAEAAARKIHAALPRDVAAAIPWTLILQIILELLIRCPMAARPEVLRKRALDGLSGKKDERTHIIKKVNRVAAKCGCVMPIERARTIAGTILQAAAESEVDELAAILSEARESRE